MQADEEVVFEPGTAPDGNNTPKAILRPRNPGESLKIATTVLRRRDRNLKANAERAAKVAQVRREKQKFEKGKIDIMRAEKFVKNARQKHYEQRRINKVKAKTKNWPNPKIRHGKSKALAVVRNGRPGGCPESRAVLRFMNLKKKNTLIMVRNSPETLRKLMIAEPFIYWGPISFKTCFNLIHKKAMFKAPGGDAPRVMLSDNTLIEEHLGDIGLLCTEDLAACLHNVDDHFEKVKKRLFAFELDETRLANHMVWDKLHTWGDKGEMMDGMIAKLIAE